MPHDLEFITYKKIYRTCLSSNLMDRCCSIIHWNCKTQWLDLLELGIAFKWWNIEIKLLLVCWVRSAEILRNVKYANLPHSWSLKRHLFLFQIVNKYLLCLQYLLLLLFTFTSLLYPGIEVIGIENRNRSNVITHKMT